MLDTRVYDRDVTTLDWNNEHVLSVIDEEGRSLMGTNQEDWFYDELKKSSKRGAAWRFIGTQVLITHIAKPESEGGGDPMGPDGWDGYRANRNRTLAALYDNHISDNIFLAGDSHKSWVSDVPWEGKKDYDPKTGKGAIGVEFGGTAVSSPGMEGPIKKARKSSADYVERNDALKWAEFHYRGYMEVRVSPDRVDTEYFGVPDVKKQSGLEFSLANFTVEHGANSLKRPIAGGKVADGGAQGGKLELPKVAFDTEKGDYVPFES